MTASRQKIKAWDAKLADLAAAAQKAQEDILVGLYQAREEGLSFADLARGLGFSSASSVPTKVEQGRKILEERKRKRGLKAS